MFNNASENRIPSNDRQFACKDCDKMWWRRVPQRKEASVIILLLEGPFSRVSKCHSCRKKYDPVPHDKMWGFAEFHCRNCNRTFNFAYLDVLDIFQKNVTFTQCRISFRAPPSTRPLEGFSQMGLSCPCYICGTPVLPSRILPPRRNSGPRTRNPHSCFGENCYNRRDPYISGLQCVHPRSRAKHNHPKVLYPSMLHVSTGSTVATCLSQGSLTQCDLDDLILDDIQESGEDESDSNDS
ncbi:unnamed protein product [Ranitomeya imitator]|uniref:Uncharacterized protein n=1 Tax=Ranitomeya imitator TaxID=111125 RepID=A0ABN9MNS7_9NEOB|nr:unnamed protein product [Ranitomeya imitator]